MAGVYNIPAGLPFADLVAQHLLQTFARPDPLELSRITILVPNRRAVGTIREAFLRAGNGKVMLLPAIRSIADGAEEGPNLAGITGAETPLDGPVPIEGLPRRLALTRLIGDWAKREGCSDIIDLARAFLLAADLAALIDELHTEDISPMALLSAAPEDFQDRWEIAMGLLTIAIEDWPAEKKRLNLCDPPEHRDLVLRAFAKSLIAHPPMAPIIVAGSTGSIPSTAELMAVIANLADGMIVLPGLDRELDPAAWDAVGPEHPQSAMKRLLDTHMKIGRAAVLPWPGVPENKAQEPRQKLVSELLRPAVTTDRWREGNQGLSTTSAEALDGISYVEAPGQREEAQTIALALRDALETPGRTAALVTPDRTLAARVMASLRRWDIRIDDSGGTPLGLTMRGGFLMLLAEAAESNFAPIPLLSLLKHPLAAGGLLPGEFKHQVRVLERAILRGPRPASGLDGLLNALATKSDLQDPRGASNALLDQAREFLTNLTIILAPLSALATDRECPLAESFTSLIKASEALAATPEQIGAERMWSAQDGNAAFAMIHDLSTSPDDQPLSASAMVQILRAAMADVTVRSVFDLHPRIHIWGTPEARMQQTDLVILGGLTEGVWPALPKVDIWLNRPMRERAGLASPERRIGLAAHDFAQGLAAPQVLLTRSRKIDGTPQVAARWLFRLESLVEGLFGKDRLEKLKSTPWLQWADMLDKPEQEVSQPVDRPSPRPPLAARPKQLSVTRIETWIRDPYALYAREILKLRPLDPIDQDPSHLERGIIVHRVFERFVEKTRQSFPEDDEATKLFTEIAEEELDHIQNFPAAHAFWRERVLRAGKWFIGFEAEHRAEREPLALEVSGQIKLGSEADNFILTAKADRIDRMMGGLVILDYKTGQASSKKEVKTGLAPQLPLEGLIVQAGGFENIPPSPVAELGYILVGGGSTSQKYNAVAKTEDAEEIINTARDGLISRIQQFADEGTPYPSRVAPKNSQLFGDYDHLARVREWSLAGADEGSE